MHVMLRPEGLEFKAMAFASWFHAKINHRRKYTGEHYIVHPEAVVDLVRSVPNNTEVMRCAAWLHDVVEDTEATLPLIEKEFGSEVAVLVEMLTDISKPSDGNRALRKAIDRQHTAKASPEAKTIKLADLIDNSRSILAHDPEFATIYIEEKRALLGVLAEGDPALLRQAWLIVEAYSKPLR